MLSKRMRFVARLALLCAASLGTACARDAAGPLAPAERESAARKANGHAAILVGAGDIADCGSPGDEATAALLDDIAGTVFTAGDNAYPYGSPIDYESCYDPTWGRHRHRTRPALGNHEYLTPGAAGYFLYFRDRPVAPPFGFYSYDLGRWHVVVLNSNLEYIDPALQELWLVHDLRTHRRRCTLAYFHHPRFSSGRHGSQPQMQRIWEILYAHGADVVVAGHDHSYERFAPQDAHGRADPRRGVRQFVVGTGGAGLYEFGTVQPNSEFRYNAGFAVIRLALRPAGYGWELIGAPDGQVIDSGSDRCH